MSTNPQRKVDITDDLMETDVSFSYVAGITRLYLPSYQPTKQPNNNNNRYSVEWVPKPELTWENRMSRYHDSRFLPGALLVFNSNHAHIMVHPHRLYITTRYPSPITHVTHTTRHPSFKALSRFTGCRSSTRSFWCFCSPLSSRLSSCVCSRYPPG